MTCSYSRDVLNELADLIEVLADTEYTHGLLTATGRNPAVKKIDITGLWTAIDTRLRLIDKTTPNPHNKATGAGRLVRPPRHIEQEP